LSLVVHTGGDFPTTAGTKANPVEGEHQLFGFLTTDAGAIHPKAMPVILTSAEAVERRLTTTVPGC
jgi:hypothetical protein